jgi:hypothetical protein
MVQVMMCCRWIWISKWCAGLLLCRNGGYTGGWFCSIVLDVEVVVVWKVASRGKEIYDT